MTLLVRDEEDIISSNIDFHLSRGVDHFLVMDNLSEDRTAKILLDYQSRGVVTYIFQPQDDYSQAVWVTQMAQQASREMRADWVINNDADEFWWPEGGDLKEALAAVPSEAEAVRVERSNFIPATDRKDRASASAQHFATAMTVRERQSLNAMGQPLPPKLCHRGFDDVVVAQGNHDATLHGRQLLVVSAPLSILHFPVRTYDQLSNKITKGGAAYQRNTVLPEGVGATWRRLHALQAQGALRATYDAMALSEAEITEGLASGRLLRDERLRDALAALERE